MKNKIIATFFFIGLLSLASLYAEHLPSEKDIAIADRIQAIPIQDQSILKKFFRNLLFAQGFAYTLFGDKPISIDNYNMENPEKPELDSTSPIGYKTWGKYAGLFPQDNYIFLFYENSEDKLCEITLINKKAFHQVFAANSQKFTEVFGSEITSEKLLNLLIQRGSLWNTRMKERDDLIGILLGYGKINAELYQKRSEIGGRRPVIKQWRTTPSQGYDSIEEELCALRTTLQPFDKQGRTSLNLMRLPSFVADPNHPETAQLKKKYAEQRKQITRYFSQGQVLDVTFKQLSACDSEIPMDLD